MMKRSLVIPAVAIAILLIGVIVFITRDNNLFQERNNEIKKEINRDNFDILDEQVWTTSSKKLGRSQLNPENIEVTDGFLNIRLPANTLTGGEIVNQKAMTYGSYEIRMKLPEADSSITGFFLYAPPDYFYEIDIEIYNNKEGVILLTTYAEGEVQNEYIGELGFDPTADFHNYRFDYTKDGVAYYVDNQFIKEWKDGFPQKQEMQLMVNTWYPNWLAGTPTREDQFLQVDWLEY